jgi:hypothetical protein
MKKSSIRKILIIKLGPLWIVEFAAGIVDTGGKFATGINNTSETGGNFVTGVFDTGGAP